MKYTKKIKFWIAFLLLTYTFMGFIILPWFITNKLPTILKNKAGINISISKAYFNPYSFELTLNNITLYDLKKQPVFKLKKFYINYTIFGLFDKTFLFDNISLNSPLLYATINQNGDINLNNILPKNTNKENISNSKKTSLPSIMLRKIDITNGQIKIKDSRKDRKFTLDLGPYDFIAHDISTNKGKLNAYTFETLIDGESKMSWRGGMSIEPLKLYGKLILRDLKLPKIYKYTLPNIDTSLEKGSLWLTLPYQIDISKSIRFRINNARFHLVDLVLKEKKTTQVLVDAKNISVTDFNLDWPKQDILIDGFKLSDTNIYPKLQKDGKLNFVKAFTITSNSKKEDSNSTKTQKSWSYILKNTHITRTNIYFENLNLKEETKTALKQISLHIKNISSNKQNPILYKLSSTLNQNSHISISGDVIQKPLSTKSNIKLSNILPNDFINYINPYINFNLKSISIYAQADINATFDKDAKVELVANSSLDNLAIDSKDGKKLVRWKKFTIHNLNLKWPKNSAIIKNISLSKAFINAELYKNGDVNLFKAFIVKNKKREETKKSKSWQFFIKSADIDKSSLRFLDSSLSLPALNKLSSISLHVENISSNKKLPIRYNFKSKLNKKATINLRGKIIQKPLNISSKIEINNIKISKFQNYFSPYINFKLKNANLNTDGNLKISFNKKPKIALNINTSIDDLLINSKNNQKLLQWRKLSLKDLKFQNSPMLLNIKTIELDKPYIRAHIAKDHSTNFSNLIKKDKLQNKNNIKKETNTEPLKLKIGDIKLADGITDFSDDSVPFPFYTSIHDLNGYITTLDSDYTTPSKLKLEGKIDKYGYANIKGILLPFKLKQKADIDILFKNINLTSLTPYSGKFLGYKIKNGKLSMDLNYKISKTELIGKNKINIDTLELGDSVKSKDAVNLPLKLALALLSDSNNQIDIDLPVSGDMNNPDFSYGSIVWKAIGNMITGIVSAPFKFLGSLLGIKGEDLKAIDFEAGSHKIISSEFEKLENLNKIMSKRPNIKLEIAGGYNKIIDTKELQKKRFEKIIKSELKSFKKDTNSTQVDNYGKVLHKLYTKTYSAKKYKKLVQKFTIVEKTDTNKTKKVKTLDTTALNAQMKNDLAQKIKIPEKELISLANMRANTIKNTLVQKYKLSAERVKILPPQEVQSKRDRWVICKLKISI